MIPADIAERVDIIRSARRTSTVAIRITSGGRIEIRAPLSASDSEIYRIIGTQLDRIRETLEKERINRQNAEAAGREPLSAEKLQELSQEAMDYIPGRCRYWAEKTGVSFNRITIRNQRTRWGSCSGKGNLNFNCMIMLAPKEVIDAVVVHELCHLREPNHSAAFYAEVLRVLPDYYERHGWLKEHGAGLMALNPNK